MKYFQISGRTNDITRGVIMTYISKKIRHSGLFFVVITILSSVILMEKGYCDISAIEKFALSTNTGWINFHPENGGVTLHDDGANRYLTGFAWSENTGWIKLGCDSGGPYSNSSSENWGVNIGSDGILQGYGWSRSVGWINFGPSAHSSLYFDSDSGLFEGFAWGENIGWIHFGGEDSSYRVASPRLGAPDFEASESAGFARFTIEINRLTEIDATVNVTTADGTAVAGEDYIHIERTVTINAGESSATVDVQLIVDEIDEPLETFSLVLSNPDGASILDSEAVCTIIGTPFVETITPALNIGEHTATVSGYISGSGGMTVTERGFCVSMFRDGAEYPDGECLPHAETGTGTFSTSLANLNAGTTYYYRAYAANTQGVAQGELLEFLTLPSTTKSGATPMSFGTYYSADYPNSSTWYKLENLVAGQGVCLVLDAGFSTGGYLDFTLLDAGNNVIAESNNPEITGGGSGRIDTVVSANGDYYIMVDGTGYTGNYDIVSYNAWFGAGVVEIPGYQATPSTARFLEAGDYGVGTEEEYFRLIANAGQTISLGITPTIDWGNIEAILYDGDGNIVSSSGVLGSGQTGRIEYDAPVDDLYYVGIRPAGGARGSYNLRLYSPLPENVDTDGDGLPDAAEYYHGTNVNGADTDGDGISDYDELAVGRDPLNSDVDLENHGTPETAMAISEDTILTAEIPSTSETWFRFDMPAGDIVKATFTVDTDTGSIRAFICDSEHNPIRDVWHIYGGETASISHTAAMSGVYYLKIENYDINGRHTNGRYTLALDRSAIVLEHAIRILQTLVGLGGTLEYKIDINVNGKNELEDVIFSMQYVAGLR